MRRLSICGSLHDPATGLRGEEACLTIEGDRIVGIREEPTGDLLLDLRGRPGHAVLPGLVDMHTHLRGMKLSYKEDEATATAAAARGGITLVADMPNTLPRLDTAATVAEKLSRLKAASRVEYMVYAAVPPSLDEAEKIARQPSVAGFKIYPADLVERHSIVEALLAREWLVVAHAELPEAEKIEYEDLETRASLRGCHWEAAAVEYLASLRKKAHLHITHASCHSSLRRAKSYGLTVDTTPHYMFYTAPRRSDCLWKVNPPLRPWPEPMLTAKELIEGGVDAVASDHAPHAAWEKHGDPLLCPPGIPWLEAWPHMLYCLVKAGALTIGDYIRLASQNPARILGKRRCLAPGCPASITILAETHTRFAGNTESRARLVPYWMHRLCSETVATLSRGNLAYLAPGWRMK